MLLHTCNSQSYARTPTLTFRRHFLILSVSLGDPIRQPTLAALRTRKSGCLDRVCRSWAPGRALWSCLSRSPSSRVCWNSSQGLRRARWLDWLAFLLAAIVLAALKPNLPLSRYRQVFKYHCFPLALRERNAERWILVTKWDCH